MSFEAYPIGHIILYFLPILDFNADGKFIYEQTVKGRLYLDDRLSAENRLSSGEHEDYVKARGQYINGMRINIAFCLFCVAALAIGYGYAMGLDKCEEEANKNNQCDADTNKPMIDQLQFMFNSAYVPFVIAFIILSNLLKYRLDKAMKMEARARLFTQGKVDLKPEYISYIGIERVLILLNPADDTALATLPNLIGKALGKSFLDPMCCRVHGNIFFKDLEDDQKAMLVNVIKNISTNDLYRILNHNITVPVMRNILTVAKNNAGYQGCNSNWRDNFYSILTDCPGVDGHNHVQVGRQQ